MSSSFFYKLNNYLIKKNNPLSVFEYLNSGDRVGYEILKFFYKKSYFNLFLILIRNIFSMLIFDEYKVVNTNIKKKNKFLILSWGFKEDFDKNGNFYDKYLNINSAELKKEYLWLVVYLSNDLPNKINENIVIYKKKKKFFSLNLFFKNLIKIFFISNKNFSLTFSSFNKSSLFAINFYDELSKILNFNIFTKIIIVYEGQPYQKYFIEKIKNINARSVILGILHHPPHSLMFNFFKQKKITPDKLVVSGSLTKEILIKNYNWKKNQIIKLSAFRFKKKRENIKKIFISANIINFQNVFREFKSAIIKCNFNIFDYTVSAHPKIKTSQEILKLIKNINAFKLKTKKFRTNPRNLNICIGVTSAVVELLESSLKVMHITEIPFLEKYDKSRWTSIKIKNISKNSYICSLTKNNIFEIKNKNSNNLLKSL